MAENTKNKNQTKEEETVKEKNGFLKGTLRRMKNGAGWMVFGLAAGAAGMYAVMSGRKQAEETGGEEESEDTAEESSEESSEE